jgi:hypothetical protein
MKKLFEVLLPAEANNNIHGSKIPIYFLVLIAFIGTIRSFIHMFFPDGGAGSIAGMNIPEISANEILFVWALWGSAQLIYALIQWIVILRYRSLVPLMWVVQLLETLLRMFVGHIKPVIFTHTPPGAYGNYIYLFLALLMLALSIGLPKSNENNILILQ